MPCMPLHMQYVCLTAPKSLPFLPPLFASVSKKYSLWPGEDVGGADVTWQTRQNISFGSVRINQRKRADMSSKASLKTLRRHWWQLWFDYILGSSSRMQQVSPASDGGPQLPPRREPATAADFSPTSDRGESDDSCNVRGSIGRDAARAQLRFQDRPALFQKAGELRRFVFAAPRRKAARGAPPVGHSSRWTRAASRGNNLPRTPLCEMSPRRQKVTFKQSRLIPSKESSDFQIFDHIYYSTLV